MRFIQGKLVLVRHGRHSSATAVGSSPAIRFDRIAQPSWQRHRLVRLKRDHRIDHAGAQPLDLVLVANDDDSQRGGADALDQQTKIDDIAHPARNPEVAFDVNEGKSVPIADDQLGIIVAKLLRVPIFDQAVEHVEVMREIDDPGRIAMRKANRHAASKCCLRRHESMLGHLSNQYRMTRRYSGMISGSLSGNFAIVATSMLRCWATSSGGVWVSQSDNDTSAK